MLQVNNMNYNASAVSIDNQGNTLANFSFSADNYSNYSFNINYRSIAAITSTDVALDFESFKTQAANIIADDIAPFTVANPSEEEE